MDERTTMTNNKGMLTLAQLSKLVKSNDIETVLLVMTDIYGRFMGKRLDANFFLEEAAKEGVGACNYLLVADMEMQPDPDFQYTNWETGYGDFRMIPDLSTLRIASWLEKTAIAICDVADEKHNHLNIAPRSILQKQLTTAKKMGYQIMAASELEYYLFQSSYEEDAKLEYNHLKPSSNYIEDYHVLATAHVEKYHSAVRRHLNQSGVPVEASKGEWGIGQHELNVRYADILSMADRHAVYKECLKEVADQMDLSVTFMAKYVTDQAGSSCHIHLSLYKNKKNAFVGKQALGRVKCSDAFRWFLGGWIQHLPEMMVCYAPTVNSYKRYVHGTFAPTSLAWSYDNRSAGFRIVGSGESLRIECRVPGADCNPYIAFSAALASGLDGIANKIEPPPELKGDAYSAHKQTHVPNNLKDATHMFQSSQFAKQVFGEEVVNHYTHFFEVEQTAFEKAVTDWERKRYFERI